MTFSNLFSKVIPTAPLLYLTLFTRSQELPTMSLQQKKEAAVWGMLIGDSIAMPVHWYYSPPQIKRDYHGWLKGFEAPKEKHPTCILNLSATDGSGRSTTGQKPKKSVIGDIILHDKLKYWQSKEPTHYHRGMKAGENTLNAVVALEMLKVMAEVDADVTMEPRALRARVIEHYVKFMTTPGSHNDTYAESYHRSFFRAWGDIEPEPPTHGETILEFFEKRFASVCAETEDHQLAAVGAFTGAMPWTLHYAGRSAEECAKNTWDWVQLTHPAPSLEPYVKQYARLLQSVLHGADLQNEALKVVALPEIGGPRNGNAVQRFSQEFKNYEPGSEEQLLYHQEAVAILGMACNIPGAMSSLLFLATNFHDDFKTGVLTNANCGGENAHRGAALGALLGVNTLSKENGGIPSEWKEKLVLKPDICKINP